MLTIYLAEEPGLTQGRTDAEGQTGSCERSNSVRSPQLETASFEGWFVLFRCHVLLFTERGDFRIDSGTSIFEFPVLTVITCDQRLLVSVFSTGLLNTSEDFQLSVTIHAIRWIDSEKRESHHGGEPQVCG